MPGKKRHMKSTRSQTVASYLGESLGKPLSKKSYLGEITFGDLAIIGKQLGELRTHDVTKFDKTLKILGLPNCYCWP
jgi:hypothetical protein